MMRALKLFIALAGTAALTAACSLPEEPAGTALIYGISIYDVSAGENVGNNLTYTDDDAEAMAAMLSARGWSVKAGIADTQTASQSQDATRAAIESYIADLAGTEDLVLFYYSGHGTYDYDDTYIIPFGAIENPADMISADELLRMFKDHDIKNVVIMLDSCYSGGFARQGATVDAVPAKYGTYDPVGFMGPEGDIDYAWFVDSLNDAFEGYILHSAVSGAVVLAAAGSEEFSWESGGHGIFTAAVLAAMQSTAADYDSDGYVSTGELYAYCFLYIDTKWNVSAANIYSEGQYADYLPHLSGTAREYALWATN